MDKIQGYKIISQVKYTYNQIAEHFSLTRQKLWDDFHYFTPFTKDGQEVLDIGCGNGRLIELFGEKKINYLGIDISEKLIYEAKNRRYPKNINTDFKVRDILEYDIGENKYDVILLVAVLQHFPKVFHDEIVKKLNKALKPDGVLLMTNWNMWQSKYNKFVLEYLKTIFLKNIDEEKFGVPIRDYRLKDVFITYQPGNDGQVVLDRYHYAFTKGDIRKLLVKNNFTIIKNLYTYNKEESTIFKAKNLLTIAKKN